MSFLSFFKKKTTKQIIQENQRLLKRSIRELEREKNKLEASEKKMVSEIKKMAQLNQNEACKTMAKEIVFIRKNITQIYNTRAKLNGISMKLQSIRSTEMTAQAMKGAAKSMSKMNQTINIPEIQQMMVAFEKNTDLMDIKSEMVEEMVSEAVNSDEAEQETNVLVSNILDEIGVSLGEQMPTINKKTEKQQQTDKDMQDRLNTLKKI